MLSSCWAASSSSLNCSLNGVLSDQGDCVCDAPWKGKNCSVFNILPRKVGSLPAYGFSPNVSSWGGNIIKNDEGGYDLWVSEMVDGCGLIHWGTNSRIIQATSDSMDATKPFVLKKPILETWAHNAAPVRAPATHKPCPRCYYLFHIGTGVDGHPKNCNNGSHPAPHDDTPTSSGLVHRSTTADGPWLPLPQIANSGCNNPAPAFDREGLLYVLCNSNEIFKTSDPTIGSLWEKHASLDLNKSPWTDNGGPVAEYIRIEDPYLWQDANTNWHLLVHRYDYRDGWPVNKNQSEPVLVSGHAFSTDAVNWHYSMGPQPFDPWVAFEDGTQQNFSTFERPHLVFNDQGVPTHTVHGASPVWDQYGDHHPCEVCPARPGTQHSCVVCKSSEYYSWTYTLTQELYQQSA